MQFKIWVCMECTNEFQTVTTKPFMVAVQCNPSSTTITVVDNEMMSSYAYHRRVQTFESNDQDRSIYFEFNDFSSSSLACPIIQYRIKAMPTFSTDNENSGSPNYLYGRDDAGNYVYQLPTPCYDAKDPNCVSRQMPDNSAMSANFQTVFPTFGYSPNNPAQYTDQDPSSVYKDGDGFGQTSISQWPITSDSIVWHIQDCTENHNQISTCSKPPFDSTRPERSWLSYDDPSYPAQKKYRMYVFNTKIVQKLTFTIEAMAEGGATHEETGLVLDVQCPSYLTVSKATYENNGRQFIETVDLYIGGTYENGAEYDFPSWYPSYEYCNFITGYKICDEPPKSLIQGMYGFGDVKTPDGMQILFGANHQCDRRPCTPQTIRVETTSKRTYEYYIMVETKMTKNSWEDYVYTFNNEKFTINVNYGILNPAKVDAPASGFPSETGHEMYKILTLDSGTDGFIDYDFSPFDCYGSTTTQKTCLYYNISSSNTEFTKVTLDDGSKIAEPVIVNQNTTSELLRVTLPTTTLRNASSGNQIQFYIYGAYNYNPTDNSADGRYAAWSQLMKFDVACGSETLSYNTQSTYYFLQYNEGSWYDYNATYQFSPEKFGMSSDKIGCPIIKFEAFEDSLMQVPWVNTSIIDPRNLTSPDSAYINIATFEHTRYTWWKNIYFKASTVGGKSNSVPIHIQIEILPSIENKTEINFAPQFIGKFQKPTFQIFERDKILGNSSVAHYWSPQAQDRENDAITMIFQGFDQYRHYIYLEQLPNNTFYMSVNTTALQLDDQGNQNFKILLKDNVTALQSFNVFSFAIDYMILNPIAEFRVKVDVNDTVFGPLMTANKIESLEVICTKETNSTPSRNLCADVRDSFIYDPPFEYIFNDSAISSLKGADFFTFSLDFAKLNNSMIDKEYNLNQSVVIDTLNTSYLRLNYSGSSLKIRFQNVSTYAKPSLEQLLNHVIDRHQLDKKSPYLETPPLPDLRPSPEVSEIRVFTNSTLKITFNEPMILLPEATKNIDKLLQLKIVSGDGDLYEPEQKVIEVEDVEEEVVAVENTTLTSEEQKFIWINTIKERGGNKLSMRAQKRLNNIQEKGSELLIKQLLLLTEKMSPDEIDGYIKSITTSKFVYNGKRQLRYEESIHHEFKFSLIELDEADLWVYLNFTDFKWVSINDVQDQIVVDFRDQSLIVSEATLKPIDLNRNDQEILESLKAELPPLQPSESENAKILFQFLSDCQFVIISFQFLAVIQNSIIKGRSLQSVYSMVNYLSLISHMALFNMKSIPGNVYVVFKFMNRFYSTHGVNSKDQNYEFTIYPPYNRNFQEMGYFTTNFVALQKMAFVCIGLLVSAAIAFRILITCTKKFFLIKCCRRTGMFLPQDEIFRRIIFRLSLLSFLEMFMSAFIAADTFESVAAEFEKNTNDGLSALSAVILMGLTLPVIGHMFYVIVRYKEFLQDQDIIDSVGHYYSDLRPINFFKTVYHVVFLFRRVFYITIMLCMSTLPNFQFMLHLVTTLMNMNYVMHFKPFDDDHHNYMEVFNEFCVFILCALQQTFLNTVIPADIIYYYGWYFIGLWFFMTIVNLVFVVYKSFYINYFLTLFFVEKQRVLRNQEKAIENQVKFKDGFMTDNTDNQMCQFEMGQGVQFLELKQKEVYVFGKFALQKMEIEWLEKNDLPVEQVYEDYVRKEYKNMYNIPEQSAQDAKKMQERRKKRAKSKKKPGQKGVQDPSEEHTVEKNLIPAYELPSLTLDDEEVPNSSIQSPSFQKESSPQVGMVNIKPKKMKKKKPVMDKDSFMNVVDTPGEPTAQMFIPKQIDPDKSAKSVRGLTKKGKKKKKKKSKLVQTPDETAELSKIQEMPSMEGEEEIELSLDAFDFNTAVEGPQEIETKQRNSAAEMFNFPIVDEEPINKLTDAQKALAMEVQALEEEERHRQDEQKKIDHYFENI